MEEETKPKQRNQVEKEDINVNRHCHHHHPVIDDNSNDNRDSSPTCTDSSIDIIISPDGPNTTTTSWYRIRTDGPKGRGLFAVRHIPPHTLIHIAPCIRITEKEYTQHMRFTVLEHYLFNDRTSGDKLLALGHGSLFNHSSRKPNISYRIVRTKKHERTIISTTATTTTTATTNDQETNENVDNDNDDDVCIYYSTGYQSIKVGQELCISYGASDTLWFDDASYSNNSNDTTNDDNDHFYGHGDGGGDGSEQDDTGSDNDDDHDDDDDAVDGMPSFLNRMEL